jgi:hypothetical protein
MRMGIVWEGPMALWASLIALLIGSFAVFAGEPNYTAILRSVLELGAVIGVFTLICAAEASN